MPMGFTGAPTALCNTLATHLYNFLVTYYMELFMDDGTCAANTFRDMMDKITTLTAIIDWPQPENTMNLASFLGLTGFYYMLIKAYVKRKGAL